MDVIQLRRISKMSSMQKGIQLNLVSQGIAVEAKVEHLVHPMRWLRARNCPHSVVDPPINFVPQEILEAIFHLVITPEDSIYSQHKDAARQRAKLLRVCKHWRDCLINNPPFWTDIVVTSPPAMHLNEHMAWLNGQLLSIKSQKCSGYYCGPLGCEKIGRPGIWRCFIHIRRVSEAIDVQGWLYDIPWASHLKPLLLAQYKSRAH